MGLRKDYYKVSGGDGIPPELFQILNDDAIKMLLPLATNLQNSAVATGSEKVSFNFSPKEGQCQKCLNYSTIAFISHASKVMLKVLGARLQHT